MFCGECGTKNESESSFCLECGAPLRHDEKIKNDTNNKILKKEKKQLSKKNKIILVVVLLLVVVLGGLYKVVSDMTNPKTIAKDYIEAVVNQDAGRLYKYVDITGDKTFVSKKIFVDSFKDLENEDNYIENYKINDLKYGSGGLTVEVLFTYTVKGDSEEYDESIKLIKQKDKKYLFFDDWKIADLSESNLVEKDYVIKAIKGSKVTFAGILLTDKYLDKEKTTDKIDYYVLPNVFDNANSLKVVLPNGLEVQDTVYPDSDSNYMVDLDLENLSDDEKTNIENVLKINMSSIYNHIIARTLFDDIKSEYESEGIDLTNLNNSYNNLYADLESAYSNLTSIDFTNIEIDEIGITDEGYIEVEFNADYDYTVEYKNWNDEVQTHTDKDYTSGIDMVLSYKDNTYYLVNFDDFEDYFSRY